MSGKTWREERDVAEAVQDDTIQEKGNAKAEESGDVHRHLPEQKLSCRFGEDETHPQ